MEQDRRLTWKNEGGSEPGGSGRRGTATRMEVVVDVRGT